MPRPDIHIRQIEKRRKVGDAPRKAHELPVGGRAAIATWMVEDAEVERVPQRFGQDGVREAFRPVEVVAGEGGVERCDGDGGWVGGNDIIALGP
ncbi:hypothetical protein BP5796_03597 [Coleophoma crateriformis]|uniref:Uncharacterized protein n=1 Tax=Coleophoma crateriformis TaxID=565419 RepID=A0A3D8SNJ6_9HELO|nr:hypothetical protein BP5796_03597 [Coleophoma crateriformis]